MLNSCDFLIVANSNFYSYHNSNLLLASEKLDFSVNKTRVQFSIEIYYCARSSQSIDSISLSLRDFNLYR